MLGIGLNTTRFPLVIARFPKTYGDDAFEKYLTELLAVYRRHERFALVIDSSASPAVSAHHRKRQADFLREHALAIRLYNAGTAFVLPTAMMRGVLTAILWLEPLPCPHAVFASLGPAEAWALSRLDGPELKRNDEAGRDG